jgi:hypothetical protein
MSKLGLVANTQQRMRHPEKITRLSANTCKGIDADVAEA